MPTAFPPRSLICCLLLVLTGISAPGDPAETANEIVQMPAVVVAESADLPPPEPWRCTNISGFEVLSNVSDAATLRILRDFERFRMALDVVWPIGRADEAPGLLILCRRRSEFERFAGPSDAAPDSGRTSLFVRDAGRSAIVLDLETRALDIPPPPVPRLAGSAGIALPIASSGANADPDATDETDSGDDASGSDTGGLWVSPATQLCREYVRFELSHSEPRLPPWLEEGLAQLFMGLEISPRVITFARITPSSDVAEGEEGDFNTALKHQSLMPLAAFFAVRRDSPEAAETIGSIWAKQAEAFVHLCLYGEKGRYRASFLRLVERAGREPLTEKMFTECFGFGFRRMQSILSTYVAYPRFEYIRFSSEGAGLPAPVPPVLADAAPAEAGLMLGDALSLAGRRGEALREWRLAYARGGREPDLLAALAVGEFEAGNTDRAGTLLGTAVAGGTTRAQAYVTLVRLKIGPGPEPLDPRATADALRLLFAARRLGTVPAGVYRSIAEVWRRSTVMPTAAHLGVLYEGLRKFPRDAELACDIAELEHRVGRDEEAAAAVARAEKIVDADAATQRRIAVVKAGLQSPPPVRSSAFSP